MVIVSLEESVAQEEVTYEEALEQALKIYLSLPSRSSRDKFLQNVFILGLYMEIVH